MAWMEVEAKIKVKHPRILKLKLKKVTNFIKKEIKEDSYYTLENFKKHYPKKSLRIRKKGKQRVVNFKQWVSYDKGIHVKKETEFTVSDVKKFLSLLKDFGFKKWISKHKQCTIYKYGHTSIELNKVKQLGWYLEIEHLCKKKEVPKAKRQIREVIKLLNLKSKHFEKRGYTKLLYEKKEKN